MMRAFRSQPCLGVSPRGRSFSMRGVCAAALVVAVALTAGCMNASVSSRRWLDPLGLLQKSELGDQPEFQQQVSKDPFPTASQLGLASGE